MVSPHITDSKNDIFKGVLINKNKINLNNASLNDIMRLKDIDEEIANDIIDFAKDTTITDNFDLLELESVNLPMLNSWNKFISDMRININHVNINALQKVKGVSKKLAQKILDKKDDLGFYTNLNQLKLIDGLKKDTFENIKLRFKI